MYIYDYKQTRVFFCLLYLCDDHGAFKKSGDIYENIHTYVFIYIQWLKILTRNDKFLFENLICTFNLKHVIEIF